MAPVGRVTQELVATIDGLLLSLPIPLTPISWASVDILTERATKELQFKASEEGKRAAAKQVEAELQAIEALQAKVYARLLHQPCHATDGWASFELRSPAVTLKHLLGNTTASIPLPVFPYIPFALTSEMDPDPYPNRVCRERRRGRSSWRAPNCGA